MDYMAFISLLSSGKTLFHLLLKKQVFIQDHRSKQKHGNATDFVVFTSIADKFSKKDIIDNCIYDTR
ncbi:unnamed protein product [marine sediment metagenome]|uniref:Uncharacterized protein n=1 Tax=marine sediment metagenome TaxID=412755 RepID=X0ZX70_9ZZZZ